MPQTEDYVQWLLPCLLAGLVSLAGVYVLWRGRYDFATTWEVRGPAATVLGVLLLPPLPLVIMLDPSPTERARRREELEQKVKEVMEDRQRREDLKARRRGVEEGL